MARGTICDRCKEVCSQNIYQVEAWKVDEDGKKQGAWTYQSDLCQSCYDDVKRVTHEVSARAHRD